MYIFNNSFNQTSVAAQDSHFSVLVSNTCCSIKPGLFDVKNDVQIKANLRFLPNPWVLVFSLGLRAHRNLIYIECSLGVKVAGAKVYLRQNQNDSPCCNCMHRPAVTSQANACTSQAYACMYCMHCPMMSQADACSYCMGSIVLILSWIYLYLQLL